jgi:IS4 transposase
VRIFEDMAKLMIKIARDKRAGTNYVGLDEFIDGDVYAFDSSTMSLCLSVFWWSKLHHDKGAVKLHTLYDVKNDIPAFNIITNGDIHDSKVMHLIPYEEGSYYIFDRAYMDTKQLNFINQEKAFFVVREKRKMKYTVVKDRNYDNPETGILADQIIMFDSPRTSKQYKESMRRVVFYDREGNRTFVYYTNNMVISAENISYLYKLRWHVELFFKWMKQHLRIKEFYGTSENVVKRQIYAAIITYCLVAIVEHDMELEIDTYELLRILSFSVIDKVHISDLLRFQVSKSNYQNDTQLNLKFI